MVKFRGTLENPCLSFQSSDHALYSSTSRTASSCGTIELTRWRGGHHHLHQPRYLALVDFALRHLPIQPVDDNQIERWNNDGILPKIPLSPEASVRKRYSLRCPTGRVARPPQISIAARLRIGVRPRARPHPIFWNHLRAVPSAPVKIKQGKARKVPRAHVKRICREACIPAANVMPVAWFEILHADGLRNLPVECIEDLSACRLLVDVAES